MRGTKDEHYNMQKNGNLINEVHEIKLLKRPLYSKIILIRIILSFTKELLNKT